MILKRFPPERRRRIAAWTAMAIAWSTAIIGRTLGAPAAESAEPVASPPETTPPPVATGAAATTTSATVPTMPEDGLVILRYTPIEKPAPEIRRVVVTRSTTAGGGSPAPPSPTTTTSSGS